MSLYLIIAALILAISTALTFSSKAVTNKHWLSHLFLFPVVYVLCGLPLDQIGINFLIAGLMFLVSFLAFFYKLIEGGVSRAFVIVALWVPGPAMFFNYFAVTLMAGGLVALIALKFSKSNKIDHFATLVFACCSAFLFYQYDLQAKYPHEVVTAQIQMDQTIPSLRGTQ